MSGRALLVWAAIMIMTTACAAVPERRPSGTPTPTDEPAGFEAPPSSDVLRRALRTDLCALLDEDAVTRLGWARGSQAQTLTVCAAASADQSRSVTLSIDTAVSDAPAPADGNRCTRLAFVDQATMIALKAQTRGEPDACATADRFLTTALRRFQAGEGTIEPPNPWIALDACAVLPPLLPVAVPLLGPAKGTLRQARRLGLRACIATHERGEVTLSVEPAAGRAADLDGDEVAIAARPARQREFGSTCVVRLVGDELGGSGADQTQVVTIEVSSQQVAAPQRCEAAEALVGNLVGSW